MITREHETEKHGGVMRQTEGRAHRQSLIDPRGCTAGNQSQRRPINMTRDYQLIGARNQRNQQFTS